MNCFYWSNMLKKSKFKFFVLLIILNIILRFPIITHEIGWDSFIIHVLSNSISSFGYAKWWLHPTSVLGTYPYSDASAVPFLLSGISQSINIEIELVIFIFSMILGLLSIFSAYLMAGAIKNDFFFKFFAAFVFSTSEAILTYTTWTTPVRSLFLVLFPLFIFLLLKIRLFKLRGILLISIMFILLLATHHYIYFSFPIIISYLIVVTLSKLGKRINIKMPENYLGIIFLMFFFAMFSIPFFTRLFFQQEDVSSRYGFMFILAESYIRYVGILIFYAVGGFIYLSFKSGKDFEEYFLLFCSIFLAPFLYVETYMKWFIGALASLFIVISLSNIAKISVYKKYSFHIITISLLLSVSFSGYYQFLHFLNDPNPNKRYMEERTYIGALWMKYYVNKNINIISQNYIAGQVLAISEIPSLTGGTTALVYDFLDPNKINVTKQYSIFSVEYYYKNPYLLQDKPEIGWYSDAIQDTDINEPGSYAQRWIHKFNLSYFVENRDINNIFTKSVKKTKDNVYDNGKISIWILNPNLVNK